MEMVHKIDFSFIASTNKFKRILLVVLMFIAPTVGFRQAADNPELREKYEKYTPRLSVFYVDKPSPPPAMTEPKTESKVALRPVQSESAMADNVDIAIPFISPVEVPKRSRVMERPVT